ncbi:MAG TPA: hypothetical protein VI584_07905 [Nitrospiria bacterium]|nr:hypothetical protein [Nitrospiria bacterium]
MHIPEQVRKAPIIIFTFRSIFFLGSAISYVSMGLVILALIYVLYQKMSSSRKPDLVISFFLLFLLVAAIFSYVMNTNLAASFINDIAAVTLILLLSITSLSILKKRSEKVMTAFLALAYLCFFYFKISQGLFIVFGMTSPPPFISVMVGMAEAFAVLSIIPLFLAYSDISSGGLQAILSKERIKVIIIPSFIALVFLVIDLIDPYVLAVIGTWALGFTLYLPPFVYILAAWLFTYSVIRCIIQGRHIGYALGLIYFSGFAISLSLELLTLILGFSLISLGEI